MNITTKQICRFAIGVFAMGFSTPILAQQDCADTQFERGADNITSPVCTISWVDNNELRTITWQRVEDDFQTASMTQTQQSATLISSNLPQLIDVDQDGWLDLVTFTSIGMVNGTFDIFIYEPAGGYYKPATSLFGHTLTRDEDGYIMVAGRSGPGTIKRFYAIKDQELSFQFEIDPYAIDPTGNGGGFSCDISAAISLGSASAQSKIIGKVPDNPEMLRYYCDPDPDQTRKLRDVTLAEDPMLVDRVPANTLFYCRLDGDTHAVTISKTENGMRYAYGPLQGDAELVLDRQRDAVSVVPRKGVGRIRFGEIKFANGNYAYTAYYKYALADENGVPLQPDTNSVHPNASFMRGLSVIKNNEIDQPIFERECNIDRSFDAIATLDSK